MKSTPFRRRTSALLVSFLVLLLLGATARAADTFAALMPKALAILREKPNPARLKQARALRDSLAALPRRELSDDDWLDLNLMIDALDRRIQPLSRIPAPPAPRSPAKASLPSAGILRPEVGAVTLLDAAVACRNVEPPPGAGPAPKAERSAFAETEKRVVSIEHAAATLKTDNPLVTAAARALDATARDVAFDLSCAARGLGACGKGRFAWFLERNNGLDMTPGDVRRFGEEQKAEILSQLHALAARVAPGQTWQDLLEQTRRDHHPTSNAGLLEVAKRDTEAEIRAAIRSNLVTVPEAARHPAVRLNTKMNPAFPTPFACYIPGRRKHHQYHGGTFVVSGAPAGLTAKQRAQFFLMRDDSWLRVVAGHETVPGHHLQFTRAAGIRSPYRFLGYTSVYVEGWGLYSEDLMRRAGVYRTPALALAFLRMRLWRADRVLIDVGLHCGTMRPSDAVDLLVKDIPMDRWSAEAEVRRYLVSPTQPLSYLVGFAKIRAIRRAWMAEHEHAGEKEFSDRFLSLGPVPLGLAAAVLLNRRTAYDRTHP